MLNKTKITCSINTDDQIAIPCMKSGMTGNPSSSSLSSSLPPSAASSDTSLPVSHQGATTVTAVKTSETTTVSSGLSERKLTEIEDKIPDESRTSQSTSTTVNTTATASSISVPYNMTGNIGRTINLKSQRLSVNLSASKTFNKLDPNVLRPLASAHFTRKHGHSHLSSSLSRHKRSELRRFNHHRRSGDDSESEGNAYCYTSSSEHSMDTVIFCGKTLKSMASNNNLGSPKSSFKPKVPNDSSLCETNSQANINNSTNNAKNTVTCHLSQQHDQQQLVPNHHHHHKNQLILPPKSPLSNKLASNGQQCHVIGSPDHSHRSKYKSDHKSSEHKKSSKKLVCDIGTSPLHKTIDNGLLSDELWIDKPKRAKRKKPPNRVFGKELWVDGPAACETYIKREIDPVSTCEFVEKQQRISEWVSQHSKTILRDMSSTPKQETLGVTTKTASTANTTETTASSSSSLSKANKSSNCQNSHQSNRYSSQLQDNSVKTETNEIGCQTDNLIEFVDTIENNYNKIENELNNDETLVLFNDSCDDDAGSEDWSSERRLILLERGALSDCCDKQICCCCEGSRFASDDDDYEDNCHSKKDGDNDNAEYDDDLDDIDVQSEPNNLTTAAEPPRQLKLEQFLKQLITVTNPLTPNRSNLHHHNHQHGHDFIHDQSLRYHHNLPHYHQNNQNAFHLYDTLPPRRYNRSQSLKCSEIGPGLEDLLKDCSTNNTVVDPKVNGKKCKSVEDYDISIANDELPKNHVAFIPTSPRINRILGGTPTKAECLSVTSSPSKSSRKQSFSQHKRDTTSTTTSGHGTTSEGDDRSSVTKKSSDSCSPSQLQFNSSIGGHQAHQPPQGSASSGYDSTIKDEESDREMINESNTIATNKEIMSNMSSNVNNNQGSCNIVKGSAPVKMRDKSDKNRSKNKNEKDKERSKRESISSDKCSFLCCKLTHFY